MKRICAAVSTVVLASALASVAVAETQWGSFDASRINYPTGTLTGSAHSVLRSIIEANDGVVAAPTPTLTDQYLSGVDVFYTSLLSTNTGTLSDPEKQALRTWIIGGGTLIVTGDIFPLGAYESFTAPYGVTNWRALTNVGVGSPVAQHPITENVNGYGFNTESTYTYGNDAKLLGDNGRGDDFMIVMEPATGFTLGGRILVFGDHNMFTNGMINGNDNSTLAGNMAVWAGQGPVCEQIKKLKVKCKPNLKLIGKVRSSLSEGSTLKLTRDGGDERVVVLNKRGKGKATWKRSAPGEHEVCIVGCPEFCCKAVCNP